MNQEFLVGVSHQLAPNTSLPFVHTARRSYQLDFKVNMLDRWLKGLLFNCLENMQILGFVGRRSRNKVIVGEPALGSLLVWYFYNTKLLTAFSFLLIP